MMKMFLFNKITEVVLVHCNTANNDYQQDSKALHLFVPNKPASQLKDIQIEFLNFKTFG